MLLKIHTDCNRLRHYGFKIVFIWGLCLYGVGALVAWPCLVYRSFGGFCAAIFIIGNGLGSLETAANPYITICGPPRYAELRINFSQAFNGIGTVIAPVLGSYVFFKNVRKPEATWRVYSSLNHADFHFFAQDGRGPQCSAERPMGLFGDRLRK